MWRGEHKTVEIHTPSACTGPELCRAKRPSVEKILGEDNMAEVRPFSGTEDFAHITDRVPGMAVWLGAGSRVSAPLHNPNMILDENAMELAAAIHVQIAMDRLEETHGGRG